MTERERDLLRQLKRCVDLIQEVQAERAIEVETGRVGDWSRRGFLNVRLASAVMMATVLIQRIEENP